MPKFILFGAVLVMNRDPYSRIFSNKGRVTASTALLGVQSLCSWSLALFLLLKSEMHYRYHHSTPPLPAHSAQKKRHLWLPSWSGPMQFMSSASPMYRCDILSGLPFTKDLYCSPLLALAFWQRWALQLGYFLIFDTGWCLTISAAPRHSRYSLDRRLVGPQNQCGRCGEEKKIFRPVGNRTW
jgi:hypothetical protein